LEALMQRGAFHALPAFAPASLIASNVGTWERDPRRGIIHFDHSAIDTYGFSAEEIERGVTFERMWQAVHPDDRATIQAKARQLQRTGGLMVLEYRTIPRPGEMRWILVRGRYEPLREGHAVPAGRGIVIDITESKLDGRVEDCAFLLSGPTEESAFPLDRAADLALALHHEATTNGRAVPGLLQAAKLVLHLIGGVRRGRADA
jgi:PAS domain S-box-containing protein